jgi:hypothetical protein
MRDSELFKSLRDKAITPGTVKAAVFEQVQIRNPIPANDLGVLITEAGMNPLDTAVLVSTIEEGLDGISRLPKFAPIRNSYIASIQYLASLPQPSREDSAYIKLMNVYDAIENNL